MAVRSFGQCCMPKRFMIVSLKFDFQGNCIFFSFRSFQLDISSQRASRKMRLTRIDRVCKNSLSPRLSNCSYYQSLIFVITVAKKQNLILCSIAFLLPLVRLNIFQHGKQSLYFLFHKLLVDILYLFLLFVFLLIDF